mmetsp:Transcript_4906/g.7564  ORF Transcript_4906/g.7564 Transcript_4906/m.7564 type:complete len:85 (+) Transcript_4906:773-1027(+)
MMKKIKMDLECRKKRADEQMRSIRQDWKDAKKDESQGYAYTSCMALDSSGKPKKCKHCGRDDHSRMCSKCPKWGEFQAAKKASK